MSAENGTGAAPAVPDEEQPLLPGAHNRGSKQGAPPLLARWKKALMADVQRDWADIVLLACYIITGLLDSAAISTWGSFVSMQTGNTVYLGLGLAAPAESTRWIKSGTSLGCFCLGSFLFARFHRFFSPRRRWVLKASFLAQATLTAAAAAVLTFGPPTRSVDEIGWHVLVPIALVALQSCGQAVTSRALRYNSLTSVVLTSIYCDLFSDAELFVPRNVERNRRVAAPVLLLVGAVLGGLFAHSELGIAGAMWTAVVLKSLVVVCWLLWPAEKDTE